MENDKTKPYLEVWAMLYDGKITPYDEEIIIGMIYSINYQLILQAEPDIYEHIREMDIDPPENSVAVNVCVSDISYDSGQMSHPETGQYDYPPYYSMNVKIISYDVPGELNGESR